MQSCSICLRPRQQWARWAPWCIAGGALVEGVTTPECHIVWLDVDTQAALQLHMPTFSTSAKH